MKKISVVLIAILILGGIMTSCSKDDDTNSVSDLTLIVGKWNFDRSTVSSSGFTIPFTTSYFKNEDGCNEDYIEFIKGGVVKYGNWSKTTECKLEVQEGTWSLNGSNLVVSIEGSAISGTFEIANLTATEMLLKINGEYMGKSGTFNLYLNK